MEASGERLEQLINWNQCHSSKIGDARRWNGWPESLQDLQNLIRTLSALCYSKSQPDDVDTEAEDQYYPFFAGYWIAVGTMTDFVSLTK
jgi:hypothetical protein